MGSPSEHVHTHSSFAATACFACRGSMALLLHTGGKESWGGGLTPIDTVIIPSLSSAPIQHHHFTLILKCWDALIHCGLVVQSISPKHFQGLSRCQHTVKWPKVHLWVAEHRGCCCHPPPLFPITGPLPWAKIKPKNAPALSAAAEPNSQLA